MQNEYPLFSFPASYREYSKWVTLYLFLNINQLDALNFIISLFQASTCFEHMCSPSGGQKLYYTVSGIITLIGGCPVHRLRSICARESHL